MASRTDQSEPSFDTPGESKPTGRKRSSAGARPTSVMGLGVRVVACTALVLGLGWVIATKSLPHALSASDPELALWLNPDHAPSLLEKADRLRDELLTMIVPATEDGGAATAAQAAADTGGTGGSTAPLAGTPADAAGAAEQARLRAEIGALTRRVIARDPLNAKAYRMLAEVSEDRERVRKLMQAAMRLSRRESVAVFWLLNDAFESGDHGPAVRYADVLLRTRPALQPIVMPYLAQIADDPTWQPAVADLLDDDPRWRRWFFRRMPKSVRRMETPLELMLRLRDSAAPVRPQELAHYLSFLIQNGQAEYAYNAWLQLQSPDALATLGVLNNPGFETATSGLPFDWDFGKGANAIVDIARRPDDASQKALNVTFLDARVEFPRVRQVILLTPGTHVVQGQFYGRIASKRGLVWEVRCNENANAVLGKSAPLQGTATAWTAFSFEVTVPNDPSCVAQELRLYHDARSASEEFIAGNVWFDDFDVTTLRS